MSRMTQADYLRSIAELEAQIEDLRADRKELRDSLCEGTPDGPFLAANKWRGRHACALAFP